MRISSTVDPVSQDVISWHTTLMWMLPQRTIYMDGRARPSAYAQHTWQGFSTGEWEGDMLKVTTTHLKEGWLRRNGVPRSEKATLVEYFIRHGELPDARDRREGSGLSDRGRSCGRRTGSPIPGFQLSPFSCIPTVEIERRRDEVPHHLPGANPYLTEFAAKHGLPLGGRARRRRDDVSGVCGAPARERRRQVSTGRAVGVALPVAPCWRWHRRSMLLRAQSGLEALPAQGNVFALASRGGNTDRPDWRGGPARRRHAAGGAERARARGDSRR